MNHSEIQSRYKKILLIDDDEVDLYITHRVIDSMSLAKEIVSKTSATEALDYLKLNGTASLSDLPEVIFLDLKMPEKDGFGFIEDFNLLPEQIKLNIKIVILLNAMPIIPAGKCSHKKFLSQYEVIQKPLTLEALRNLK